jgi:hypothetical protein
MRAAIITATNFRISGIWPIAWRSHQNSFGLIALKGPGEDWHLQGDTAALPPFDRSGIARIIDVNGKPLPVDFPLPTAVRP